MMLDSGRGEAQRESGQIEREQKWQAILQELDSETDGLGLGIDLGIKEGVAGLQAHEFPTRQSCEGHNDHGEALPWVSIAAPEPAGWEHSPELKAEMVAANELLAEKAQKLISLWYERRQADGEQIPSEIKINLHPQGIYGAFRLESDAQDRISGLDAEGRRSQAGPHQEEMRKFSIFLKDHFLNDV